LTLTEEQQALAAIKGDENRWWLCEGRGDGDHATLLLGWSRMVKLLAAECVNYDALPEHIAEAEAWLTRDADDWCFGRNGTAYWNVDFEDGGWAVTLVTDASSIIAP
jgi:hypothetical protein